jgi:hypothetical protein
LRVTAGCEAQVVKPKGARPIRGLQVKGKTGRVNASEPLLMPRKTGLADGIQVRVKGLPLGSGDAGRRTVLRPEDTVGLGV